MTKENTPAIDPRYDPIFQRGFGGSGAAARIRAVETPRQERPAVARRPEPQRAGNRSASANGDQPFVVPPAGSVAEDHLAPGSEDAQPREKSSTTGVMLRGNPWVATLWVVAVLLLTAGFFGTWRSQAIYVGATPITDMNEIVTFQILQTLSPSLVLVGLLVLGGLLFLHAVSWRTRTQDEPQE